MQFNELAKEVMFIYQDLDEQRDLFVKQTGLTCLSGCGQCCLSPQIEATPLQMLPTVIDLDYRGLGEIILDQLNDENNFKKPCYFYLEHSADGKKGMCTQYQTRPLICRSFGGHLQRNKNNKLRASVCKVIKEYHRESFESLEKNLLSEQHELPLLLLDKFSMKLYGLDPNLSKESLPINQALKKMLELYLFIKNLDPDGHNFIPKNETA